MTCPGCGAHLSDVLRAYQEGRPCPSCGLSASAATEVLAVQQAQAAERLKDKAAAAAIRAGKAEAEVRTLRYRLDRIKIEFELALADDIEVPEWWEPS